MMKLASVKNVDIHSGIEQIIPEGVNIHLAYPYAEPWGYLNTKPYEVRCYKVGRTNYRCSLFNSKDEALAYMEDRFSMPEVCGLHADACELWIHNQWDEDCTDEAGSHTWLHSFFTVESYLP